ncbi:MAG: hypothetical protein KME07_20320 [Pegethrix bostrychoides GSE-TBD4-15B]|jgi:hypothetical protein|uniref:Uncharacterized protein n=1 Tax=Pegethrix bostrychoides GSE-TBD4-15B TaxID=2839662 RepID=A0A951PEY1_9CYAN|nr:hypothetical protein [Pegethrix bostrychoides GSE-TBD4-15B]
MTQDFEAFTIPSTVDQQTAYAVQEGLIQRSSLQSDWAILNGTKPERFRALSQMNQMPAAEAAQSCALLTRYQAVYRPGLLKLRAEGYRGSCPSPTAAQFQQIAQHLGYLSSAEVELMLKHMAQQLREIWQLRK